MAPPANPLTLTTLILAGGQSRRMGRDKALLPCNGQPLIHHLCAVARHCTDTVAIVTPWGDRYRPLLPPDIQFIREPIAPAGIPPGPFVAFAQALPQSTTDWVLLLACDLPNLSGPILQQWASQLPQLNASTLAYLPQSRKGWEPLCGFYRRTCLHSLEAAVSQGHRAFQTWLATIAVQAIPAVLPSQLLNCNTPEQWATATGHRN
ncbi:MAG: molybdenum cofactor guanylyltransferase [Leptolyngbya sp. RL_3_1]|nr:molybdenum cofactor guanylyltransferase [Leptolyngbya sp. RL_3_1]